MIADSKWRSVYTKNSLGTAEVVDNRDSDEIDPKTKRSMASSHSAKDGKLYVKEVKQRTNLSAVQSAQLNTPKVGMTIKG
jgi:hypothetical protein